jgi:hypothetical protein
MRLRLILLIPFLMMSPSVFAMPSDVICQFLDSSGVKLDIGIDEQTEKFVGISVFKTGDARDASVYPADQVQNFWNDANQLLIQGTDPRTQAETLRLDYDKQLDVGRITMKTANYNIDYRLITCGFQ